MSEIPFVNQLGDALEVAAGRTARQPRRRSYRRVAYAVAAMLGLTVTAAATGILPGVPHEQQLPAPGLERAVATLEQRVDCERPDRLAADIQRLLDARPAWRDWTAKVKPDGDPGPCGTALRHGRPGRRLLTFVRDARQVLVFSGFSRSAYAAVLSRGGILGRLDARSYGHCLTPRQVRAFAEPAFARTGLSMRMDVSRKPRSLQMGSSDARYARGCAVISGVRPARDPKTVVVVVFSRR